MSAEIYLALVQGVVAVALAAISAYGAVALKRLSERTGVQITDERQKLLLAHAVAAVRFAEEAALQRVVSGSDQKLALARGRMREQCALGAIPCPLSDAEVDAHLSIALQTIDPTRKLGPKMFPTNPPPALGD